MKGQLRERPLAELIREISIAGLSGALRLTHERVKMIFYFESGEIIYALSNLRQYRLVECLRRWGYEKEAVQVAVYEQASDLEIGVALLASGAFSNQLLGDLMGRQVAEMLRPALLWTEGVWDFEARVRLPDGTRARFPINDLLLECARRLPAGFVLARVSKIGEKPLRAINATMGINLLPTEGFVHSRADVPISVRELITISGLPEAEAIRAVYALALSGLLRSDEWPRAFTAEEISRALASKISQGQNFAVSLPIVTPPSTSPAKEASVAPTSVEAVNNELDERRELDKLFARLHDAANFYQVLDVSRDASTDAIKRSYHAHARRFHPDLYRHHAETALYRRISSSFAKIARAYETLKDTNSRGVYDRKLAKEEANAPGEQLKR